MASEKEKKKYHEKNYAKLQSLGMSDAEIASYQGIWGNHINDSEFKRVSKKWKETTAALDSRIPEFLRNDPSFLNLPTDMKEIAVYNYEVQKSNDEDKALKLAQALEIATEQAEPYWKSIVLIAQDEILRGFEAVRGDFNSSVERQQRIIENINADLTTNKDFLSLEQQSDLSNLAKNYEINTEQLIEGAANQGMTFSTKRKIAEKRLAESNTGMVESTNRRYNKQIADLETQATRGNLEAQKELEDLARKKNESITSIGRSGETYLGTENLPEGTGYEALGNVTGSLYEDKVKDIEARKQGVFEELTQGSLQY
jgi:hypothetical protein